MTVMDDSNRPPGEDRTVFDPNAAPEPGPPRGQAEGLPGAGRISAHPLGGGTGVFPGQGRQIGVGDVLNHIYEVRRFIARGGMGEVFEGVNVNSDEKVAIKVILRHLAADPLVQAMFRKEARLLTRIRHPGLVQYRVLAVEPQFGVFYIVTEYIDGPNLSERLGHIRASPAQIARLLRKLAEGLAAAHALGAVHRDISPDNVMLEDGRLEGAKIIDFGIAKDLNAAAQTIVGDGFAGKLNYVAPEQLGDFNREVGPWTDIYSLGLTMLAVALGRDVDMGATLVEAVDKRRAGVNLSEAPEELRPVLERMLMPDPADRIRSTGAILEMLDGIRFSEQIPASPDEADVATGPGRAGPGRDGAGWVGAGLARVGEAVQGALGRLRGLPRRAMLGVGVLAVVVAGAAVMLLLPGKDREKARAPAPRASGAAPVLTEQGIAAARQAVQAELRLLPCSWLDLVDLSRNGGDVALKLEGVSGRSADALSRIEGVLKRHGLHASSINFNDVLPIGVKSCGPIDAFAAIRQLGAGRMSVAQRQFEMGLLPATAGENAGKLGAQAVVTFNFAGFGDDVALVGLDEQGEMQQLTQTREELQQNTYSAGGELRRIELNTTHSGWSGILMLTGRGPFPADLVTSRSATRGPDWAGRFQELARQRGWKAEMVWYRTVDEIPDSPASAGP